MNRALLESLLLISALACRLTQLLSPERTVYRRLPRRSGVVRNAVFRVLAASDRPLRAREIHAAAEALTGQPLCWSTVKDCLSKSVRTPGSCGVRVRHGVYRHV